MSKHGRGYHRRNRRQPTPERLEQQPLRRRTALHTHRNVHTHTNATAKRTQTTGAREEAKEWVNRPQSKIKGKKRLRKGTGKSPTDHHTTHSIEENEGRPAPQLVGEEIKEESRNKERTERNEQEVVTGDRRRSENGAKELLFRKYVMPRNRWQAEQWIK